jgi:toxin CcdB
MARFDVYSFNGHAKFVVDIQADLLQHLKTRVVVPLYLKGNIRLLKRLNPIFQIANGEYYLNTAELTTVPAATLKNKKANLENHRQEIIDALDFLLQGF